MMHFKKTLKKERQVKTMAKKKIGIIGGGISGAGLASLKPLRGRS